MLVSGCCHEADNAYGGPTCTLQNERKWILPRAEFYETAVQLGFYGLDRSGLSGKKDNVRKYWEDISIKILMRPAIEDLLARKNKLRIVDLGCGSGEGYELLTQVPQPRAAQQPDKQFVLEPHQIADYTGLDVSPGMIAQGRENYPDQPQVHFQLVDLSRGFPVAGLEPFDIYFSSFSLLSHIDHRQLERVVIQVCQHARERAYLVLDLFGRYSPEWPIYWEGDHRKPLPYTMAYLLPEDRRAADLVEWFDVTYWSGHEVRHLLDSAAKASGKNIRVACIKDRSILVGRHMDTHFFGKAAQAVRNQVNHLFDSQSRGQVNKLHVDLAYLQAYSQAHPQAWQRITAYQTQWEAVVQLLQALMLGRVDRVRQLIEAAPEGLGDEMKMLAWLYRNADRFPVADFWASIMGPQVACVLRNLELSLPDGLGCGHGLFCLAEISTSPINQEDPSRTDLGQ